MNKVIKLLWPLSTRSWSHNFIAFRTRLVRIPSNSQVSYALDGTVSSSSHASDKTRPTDVHRLCFFFFARFLVKSCYSSSSGLDRWRHGKIFMFGKHETRHTFIMKDHSCVSACLCVHVHYRGTTCERMLFFLIQLFNFERIIPWFRCNLRPIHMTFTNLDTE